MQLQLPVIYSANSSPFTLNPDTPIAVSYGMGVDSTAMLVLLKKLGIVPDAVLFADVGNEKLETMAYMSIISDFLSAAGFPELTIVRYRLQRAKYNPYRTLAGNCLANRTLPSIAFFRHGCSLKWKGAELDKQVAQMFGDEPVYRLIGYDASGKDMKRFRHTQNKNGSGSSRRPNDVFLYPLIAEGWDRERCKAEILNAGLPIPPKSSCTFCSAMKPEEVMELELYALLQIVILEANAATNLTKLVGLWHTKRMTDFIREQGLIPATIINEIWDKWSRDERVLPPDRETDADTFLEEEIDFWLREIQDVDEEGLIELDELEMFA